MSSYYDITLSARHLWIILITALVLLFSSFLIGIWVGSYAVGERPPAESGIPAENVDDAVEISPVQIPEENIPEPPPAGELPATTPPPPPTEPHKADQAGPTKTDARWTVQIMAISRADKAQTFLQKLLAAGYDSYMETVSLPGRKKLYRVRVGRYPNRGQADAIQRKLAREKMLVDERIKPWVTRL